MPRTREKLALDSARRMLHHGAFARVANLLAPLHDAEVADFLARIPLDDRRRLVGHLPPAQLARVLEVMPGDAVAETISELDENALARMLSGLERAQAASVLRSLPADKREAALQRMDERVTGAFGELLAYPEDSVGAIMRPDPFALDENLEVSEAVEIIRRIGTDMPLYAYVVDERRHLVGVLSFRQLLIAAQNLRLRDIMTPDPISIGPEEPQKEAAALVSRYDFVALPVVDEDNRLLGVVAVDEVLDMLQEGATEELYKMAGLGAGDRVFAPVVRSVRMRLPWLTINLVTAILAASVVAVFQDSIDRVVVLAVFMPIVAGMGGNAATQSLTVVIRGLALGELAPGEGLRAVLKEGATTLLAGLLLGLSMGLLAFVYRGDPVLGMVLGAAMIVNMFVAGLAGASVPMILKVLRVDPAIASSVVVTTFTDCCGFAVFLGLATVVLAHLA
jgi:magnesium transporter